MPTFPDQTYIVVDDDEDDRLLMRMALKKAKRPLPVQEFADGQELLDYLSTDADRHPDDDMHWLVIMDINMPRLNGLDTLQALRQNPYWAKLPVLMLSTADDPAVKQAALDRGANGYLVKPRSFDDYAQLFDQYFAPWLTMDSSEWPNYTEDRATHDGVGHDGVGKDGHDGVGRDGVRLDGHQDGIRHDGIKRDGARHE